MTSSTLVSRLLKWPFFLFDIVFTESPMTMFDIFGLIISVEDDKKKKKLTTPSPPKKRKSKKQNKKKQN